MSYSKNYLIILHKFKTPIDFSYNSNQSSIMRLSGEELNVVFVKYCQDITIKNTPFLNIHILELKELKENNFNPSFKDLEITYKCLNNATNYILIRDFFNNDKIYKKVLLRIGEQKLYKYDSKEIFEEITNYTKNDYNFKFVNFFKMDLNLSFNDLVLLKRLFVLNINSMSELTHSRINDSLVLIHYKTQAGIYIKNFYKQKFNFFLHLKDEIIHSNYFYYALIYKSYKKTRNILLKSNEFIANKINKIYLSDMPIYRPIVIIFYTNISSFFVQNNNSTTDLKVFFNIKAKKNIINIYGWDEALAMNRPVFYFNDAILNLSNYKLNEIMQLTDYLNIIKKVELNRKRRAHRLSLQSNYTQQVYNQKKPILNYEKKVNKIQKSYSHIHPRGNSRFVSLKDLVFYKLTL